MHLTVATTQQRHLLTEASASNLCSFFQRVCREFPFYRELFLKNCIDPTDDPLTVMDRLPVLSTEDYLKLQADIFDRIKGEHFLTDYTSGTTGARRIKFTTARDEAQEQRLCVRFFRQCGLGPGDRVVALDVDSADIHLFYGRALQQVGVDDFMYYSVPSGVKGALEELLSSQPTVILTLPSVIGRCYDELRQLIRRGGKAVPIKLIYFGEAMSDWLRERLARDFAIEVFSFYGSTEIGSMAGECRYHQGIHLYNDVVIPTILDPLETDDTLSGEVVWTTPFFYDQPLIKYATRDFVSIRKSTCACNLSYPLMLNVRRTAEQFVIYGHKFMYDAFHQVLEKEFGRIEFLRIRLNGDTGKDQITLVLPDCLAARAAAILATVMSVDEMDYFVNHDFLECQVEFRAVGSFRERKLPRIIDYRRHLGSGRVTNEES